MNNFVFSYFSFHACVTLPFSISHMPFDIIPICTIKGLLVAMATSLYMLLAVDRLDAFMAFASCSCLPVLFHSTVPRNVASHPLVLMPFIFSRLLMGFLHIH